VTRFIKTALTVSKKDHPFLPKVASKVSEAGKMPDGLYRLLQDKLSIAWFAGLVNCKSLKKC
jgi:hypothetical protein